MKNLKVKFKKEVLEPLNGDDILAIESFKGFDFSKMDFYEHIELVHEYLDILAFKLKESKSILDKEILAQYVFEFLKKTIDTYDFNSKFVGYLGKTLVTYYKNQKNLDCAVEVLEFLIFNGITENSGLEFHIQLDEFYRLRIKRKNREIKGEDTP